MYWSTVNGRAAGRPAMGFPSFAGPLRYPEDAALAESLADALARRSDPPLQPTGDTQQAYLASDNELVRYRIFVPVGYDATRRYPLVIAIHSGAGAGTYFDWEASFSTDGTASKENQLKRLAQERGYIVACPSGSGGSFGEFLSPRGEADVLDVLRRVQSVYSVDPQRVFLAGWSVGSDAVWHIAMGHPELFRAIAPVAGSAEWLDRDKTRNAARLGILFSAGASDPSVVEARRTSALAKQLLANFSYVEYPETTHDAVWTKALSAVFDFFDATHPKPETGS
jgi:poly(3-hydroxybutyrate) depolymerase